MLFTRPTDPTLQVPRTPVEGLTCAECNGTRIAAYPVLRVAGWKLVARCQDCLAILHEQDPPSPFGFTYLPYSVHVKELGDHGDEKEES